MRVLVTGGTGFVGRQLVARLADPLVLTRNAQRAARELQLSTSSVLAWNGEQIPLELSQGKPIDAVVNLMGESIAAKRWTVAQKEKLRNSRITGTRRLIEALARTGQLPKVFVSASAVGYYGDRGDEILRETSEPGGDFLARLTVEWEQATEMLETSDTRVVQVRLGVVLGAGGMLPRILPIFRWGLGGRIGDGKQWFPWIHEFDLVNLLLWTLDLPYEEIQSDTSQQASIQANADRNFVQGAINAVAPEQVSNADFTARLAKLLHRPAWFAVPRTIVKLALGELSNALLGSQRVIPEVAIQHGFMFRFPNLSEALKEILNR